MRHIAGSANTALRCTIHVVCMHACCIAGEQGMLFTERLRVLWSLVNFTLIYADESFGQACEKIQRCSFFAVWKNKAHV